MSFLKNFFTNVFDEESLAEPNSFESVSDEQLEAHLDVSRYGNFTLTDAVRPSYDLRITPAEGYRHDKYHDGESNSSVPVIMASVSKETVFEIFMEMIEPLGSVVDVVLETSHQGRGQHHPDVCGEHIDRPVLKSILWDYEDRLMNDGCTGIAVLNPAILQEVQFDEHKLLIGYGEPLANFEEILRDHDITCNEPMKFITEAEHVHSSSDTFIQTFDELRLRLGLDEMCVY